MGSMHGTSKKSLSVKYRYSPTGYTTELAEKGHVDPSDLANANELDDENKNATAAKTSNIA